ncbi:MAG TPA: hypothetical protein ENJ93_05185 [Chloroflexi bacterium]|nr:hypothetical protein [Chloroflexota bacterium]
MILPSEQDEITSRQQDAWLDHLADILQQYGLGTPALIALEAARPLSFLGGQILWAAQPTLSLFLPRQTIANAARVLENPTAVQALINRLETGES